MRIIRSCVAIIGATTVVVPSARGDFSPIALTSASFNHDVVVENSAPAPLMAGGYTSASMDAGIGNTAFSWYERGYNAGAPTTGLPPAGTAFAHQNAADHQFRMAPSYAANNAVLIDSIVTFATLELVAPAAYAKLSLLEAGGHNGVAFTYVVHHSDGAAESGGGSTPDWFNGASPAWTANGRVDVGTFAFDNVNNNNPRLYSLDITLTNTLSPVTRVDFAYSSGSGHGAIFAMSGAAAATFLPITISGYNADLVVEANGPHAGLLTGVTSATMDTGSANSFTTWYQAGYVRRFPETGLPAPGSTLTNLSAPDHRYLLPPSYTANNCLLLNSNSPTGSLWPVAPASYSALSFLVAAGNGPATIGCSIRYANGASGTNSFRVEDWFGRAPVAHYAGGRVNVTSKTVDSVGVNNPRLYAVDLALTITNSPVTNIVLTFQSATGNANTAIFAVSGGSGAPGYGTDDFNANTEAAAGLLQQWYNGAGLYDTTGWWNAANCIEAIENVIQANNGGRYLEVLTNTFTANSGGNFLNNYYDDEGWWALAWIRAYDLTGNTAFLNMARTVFSDLLTGWDAVCGGGLWWTKDRTYKNAIANELFLLVAIRLHQRTPGDAGAGSYWYWATNEWAWFKASGMINAQNRINDGLNGSCQNNGQTTWTYNQGVILGALTDLYKSTGDTNYLNQATAIADAALANLVDANGVLREPCEPGNCGGDGPQFKGIFIRHLAFLYDVTGKPSYYSFLRKNAHAVWFNDRNAFNQLGLRWSGPFDSADAARQSSALMAVSALAAPVTASLPFAKGAGDPAFIHASGSPAGSLAWICSLTNASQAGYVQTGPGITYLAPGLHAAHFTLGVSAPGVSPVNLARIEVAENSGGTTLASMDIPWNAFLAADEPQPFRLLFTNALAGVPLDFRVYWHRAPGAPDLTLTDVTIDGLMNWTAANLTHDLGRLDGLGAWCAGHVRDSADGYLSRGPGASLAPGSYSAQFELKLDNFNLDNALVATISVADSDSGAVVASRNIFRNQFPNTLYQTFTLSFNALAGARYGFRTYWYSFATAPRLSQRSVMLRPGSNSFFTSAEMASGVLAFEFVGAPGGTYTVQAAGFPAPDQWTAIGSVGVPASLGFARFMDASVPGNRFYRLVYP